MAHLFIIAAIVIWSTLGLVVRVAGVPVHVLMFYSGLFSLFFQSALFCKKSFRQSFPPPSKLPLVVVLSVCLLVNTFTFLFAYATTSIANAVLTHYIAPAIVAVLGVIFLGERVTRSVVVSIVVSSAGLWIMLGSGWASWQGGAASLQGLVSGGREAASHSLGIVSGICSGIAYAVLVILIRAFTQRLNPYALVFLQNACIVLMLSPFVRTIPWHAAGVLALAGLLHSTVAPFLYYRGLRDVAANTAAILGYFEPLGAIMTGILFLDEWPDERAYWGGALILFSGILTIARSRGQG